MTLEAFRDMSFEVVHKHGILCDSLHLLDGSRMSHKERRKSRVLRVLGISKERCLETKAIDPIGAYGPVRSFLLWGHQSTGLSAGRCSDGPRLPLFVQGSHKYWDSLRDFGGLSY